MLVPAVAALALYQPQGFESAAGLALRVPSVAIVATAAKVLAQKPSLPEPRGRPPLVTLTCGVDLPAIPFRVRLLQPCDAATPLLQRPRPDWQARAPPFPLAPIVT